LLAILGACWRIAGESLKALTYGLSSKGVPGRADAAAVCWGAISRRAREPQQLSPQTPPRQRLRPGSTFNGCTHLSATPQGDRARPIADWLAASDERLGASFIWMMADSLPWL